MKQGHSLLAAALATVLAFSLTSPASATTPPIKAHHMGAGHEATMQKPAAPSTLPEIWSAVLDRQQKMHAALSAGKLEKVQHQATAIRDLVAAMPVKSESLDADKKAALVKSESSVAGLTKLLEGAGNTAKATDAVAKLDAELKSIEGLYGAADLKQATKTAGTHK
jgi:hypothetical protein